MATVSRNMQPGIVSLAEESILFKIIFTGEKTLVGTDQNEDSESISRFVVMATSSIIVTYWFQVVYQSQLIHSYIHDKICLNESYIKLFYNFKCFSVILVIIRNCRIQRNYGHFDGLQGAVVMTTELCNSSFWTYWAMLTIFQKVTQRVFIRPLIT